MSDARVGIRELDVAIALHVCGWRAEPCAKGAMDGYRLRDVNGRNRGWAISESLLFELDAPRYSTDLNLVRVAELEIERRGLVLDYVASLGKQLELREEWESGDEYAASLFAIATADAETRCRAMIAALGTVQS